MECFTARNQFRAVKALFLPGTSLFLLAGDVGGEIKDCTDLSVVNKTFIIIIIIIITYQ